MPSSFAYKGEPPKLDIDTMKGNQVNVWKKQWLGYVDVSGLSNESESRKLNVLYQCLSPATLERLEVLVPNPLTMSEAVTALVDYAQGQVSLILERKKFVERRQHQDETVCDFSIALKQMLNRCSFNSVDHDALLVTFFVVGLRDAPTMEAILAMGNPTFDQAITAAKTREAATHTRKSVQEPKSDDNNAAVARVSGGNKGKQNGKQGQQHQQQSSSSFSGQGGNTCMWCGSKSKHTKTSCPAASSTCHTCGKRGHYARVCRSGQQSTDRRHGAQTGYPDSNRQLNASHQQQLAHIQAQQQQLAQQQQQILAMTSQDDDQWLQDNTAVAHIFQVNVNMAGEGAVEKAPKVNVKCTMGSVEKMVNALPDTGADITAAGPQFLAIMGVDTKDLKTTEVRPKAADGTEMTVLGTASVEWTLGDTTVSDELYVIEGTQSVLLSWKVVRGLGMLTTVYPSNEDSAGDARVATIDDESDEEDFGGEEGNLIKKLHNQLKQEFSDVFSDNIKIMKGEAFKIELTPDAVPRAVRAARPVPLAVRPRLAEELETLQRRDIIERVTAPSDWCSPIVLEDKPNGGVRICVDLTHLNRYVKRELYLSDPPHVLVSTLPKSAKYFTTLDATKGYHQCRLDDSSKPLTTFITPFGRFRYKRAPFGISSISEHYNRRMDEALEGIEDHKRTVDDMLLHDVSIMQQYHHTRRVLLRCREQSITLAPDKFKFCKKRVKFAGYIVTQGSYWLDTAITRAIAQFPSPKNRKGLRSFLGLVNQLASTTKSIAVLAQDLRPLLSVKNEFKWDEQHELAFKKIRQVLSSNEVLAYYESGIPSRITTDASGLGLGFVFEQKQTDGNWRMVQAGSRMLSDAESRYAAIELELLAVCYALRKCEFYVKGTRQTLLIRTDHKPLVNLINHKGMYEVENPRLRRMKEYLMQFQLHVSYVPGNLNDVADALSRAPVERPVVSSINEVALSAAHLMPHDRSGSEEALRKAAEEEEQYRAVRTQIMRGFPTQKAQIEDQIKEFWHIREEMSVHDGLVFVGKRLLVPKVLRSQILHTLHASHQGVVRTQARARESVYWPRIDAEIQELINGCMRCMSMRPEQQRQPIQQHVRPKGPGQHCAVDLFHINGLTFLVATDVFSTWPEVSLLKTLDSAAVIVALDEMWARMGLPDILLSDGGPQFSSLQFRQFMNEKRIRHVISAPAYPQSNGHAEAAVKTVKHLILKNVKGGRIDYRGVSQGLRMYRNTPSVRDGLSPAQKMVGRQLKDEATFLPITRVSDDQFDEARKKADKYDEDVARRYNQTARTLPTLTPGDRVLVWCTRSRRFNKRAIVMSVRDRRIALRTANGTIDRDRRHVMRVINRDPDGDWLSGNQEWSGGSMVTTPQWAPVSKQSSQDSQQETNGGEAQTGAERTHRGAPQGTEATNASRQADQSLEQHRGSAQEPEGVGAASHGDSGRHTHHTTHAQCDQREQEGERRTDQPPTDAPVTAGPSGIPRLRLGIGSGTWVRLPTNASPHRPVPDPNRGAPQTPAQAMMPNRHHLQAPKKTTKRSQYRDSEKDRERQRRRAHHDQRRENRHPPPVIPITVEPMRMPEPVVHQPPISITQALSTAFQTIRRSTRQRRPPDRWEDHM